MTCTFHLTPLALAAATTLVTAQTLPTVEVREPAQPRFGASAASATKSDVPLIETPQTVNVITQQQLEAQQPASLTQALGYTAGVSAGNFGRRGFDNYVIRGFDQSAYTLRDGLRLDPGFLTEQEIFGLERIEVIKGPGSVLFGQLAPGGVVNLVSKTPDGQTRRTVEGSLGNLGLARAAADLSGRFDADGRLAWRLVATAWDKDDSIDQVRAKRQYIAPSLTWKASADTQVTLLASLQRDEFVRAINLPARGTVLPNANGSINTQRYLGEASFEPIAVPQTQLGYQLSHRIDNQWTFKQNLRKSSYSVRGQNMNLGALAANQLTVARVPIFVDIDSSTTALDNQLSGVLTTGAVQHKLLLGLDAMRYTDDSLQNGGTLPVANLFTPGASANVVQTAVTANRRTVIAQTGFYAQDHMKIGKDWVVVAGVRQDSARNDTLNNLNNTRVAAKQSAATGRLGAVYLAGGGFAPYISHATSFVPVAGNPQRDGSALVPERGAQTEVGLKWEDPQGRATVNMSAYHLKRRNVVTADPANAAFSTQIGEQTHKGLELEVNARAGAALDLTFSLASIDAQITRSNAGLKGKRPTNTPEFQSSLWATYKLASLGLPGADLSLGLRHVGSRAGDALNTFDVPGYTVADLAASLRQGPWRYRLHVNNLSDKTYYMGGVQASQVSVGERRKLVATVSYDW